MQHTSRFWLKCNFIRNARTCIKGDTCLLKDVLLLLLLEKKVQHCTFNKMKIETNAATFLSFSSSTLYFNEKRQKSIILNLTSKSVASRAFIFFLCDIKKSTNNQVWLMFTDENGSSSSSCALIKQAFCLTSNTAAASNDNDGKINGTQFVSLFLWYALSEPTMKINFISLQPILSISLDFTLSSRQSHYH